MNDREEIKNILADQNLFFYLSENFRQSLGDIGLSKELIEDLVQSLNPLDVIGFGVRNKQELDEKFTDGFYRKIAGKYFHEEVVPNVKPANKILDLGCGPGTLCNLLAETKSYKEVVGVDINKYPQWSNKRSCVNFVQLKEDQFAKFISEFKPNVVVITWVLHHMAFEEQERYLTMLYDSMEKGSEIVILEDSYAEQQAPIYRKDFHDLFMKWSREDRDKILSANDWIANMVLAQRENIPMPFGYRTVEEWVEVFAKSRFKNNLQKYLGFPVHRDVNNPQSLMVFEKR